MVSASGVGVRSGQQNWEQQVEGRAWVQGSEHTAVEPSPVAPLVALGHRTAAVAQRSVSFWPSGLGERTEGAAAVPSPGAGKSPATPSLALQSPSITVVSAGTEIWWCCQVWPFCCLQAWLLVATAGLARSIWPLKGCS